MMFKNTLAGSLFFCFVATLTVAQVYTVTDLGPIAPVAINSWGQVAGNYNNQAFLWSAGRMRGLGILAGGTFSNASAINDVGVVTGSADGPGTVTPDWSNKRYKCADLTQPFSWRSQGGMHGLGVTLYYNGEYGDCSLTYYATGINIHNQIVGSNESYATYEYGFLHGNGATIFTDGYQTSANGINNLGYVAGQTTNSDSELDFQSHAVLWQNGVMTDLGTLGSSDTTNWSYCSVASAVNDVSQVVGYSSTETGGFSSEPCAYLSDSIDPFHAFLWSQASGMQDLGVLSNDTVSLANKVNDSGQVVGSSGASPSYNQYGILGLTGRGFIWTQANGMQDLNTLIPANSGWALMSAVDINYWGQIVGQGTINGKTHGFLLTPTNPFRR
jgi:probable HAF family extracellular repeat protein